jgi:type I restriction-modification system DNA methylase subunit
MINEILALEESISKYSTYSKEKSDKHGEVFTPVELINEMLDQLPSEVWSDKTKTWFDPAAGHGNFHIQVLKRLYNGLKDEVTDEYERVKHIIENQLYFAEYQAESAANIADGFSFEGKFKVNLFVGDTLNMPEDYFDKK